MGEQLRVNGFVFYDREEYKKAKKEEEAITYIRSNTNLKNSKQVMTLYERLTEKNTFTTIVGLSFLKELQTLLLSNHIVEEDSLKGIRVLKQETKVVTKTLTSNNKYDVMKTRELVKEEYKVTLRNYRIVIAFLIAIIAGLFIVCYRTQPVDDSAIRDGILNEYSQWQENLEEREAQLDAREEQLWP